MHPPLAADEGKNQTPRQASAGQRLRQAMAVGVGFEPTRRGYRLPVFKTGALNRSATPPLAAPNGHGCSRNLGIQVPPQSQRSQVFPETTCFEDFA